MSLLIIGSIALDDIQTPFARGTRIPGGSAVYAALAGSIFTRCSILACVGKDFPGTFLRFLDRRGIDTALLEVLKGKTFRWCGYYDTDLNVAHTKKTELNVFEHFRPRLSPHRRDFDTVLLANIDPVLQYSVVAQLNKPRIIAADTMNFWIQNRKKDLVRLIRTIDILFVNEHEARMLAQRHNILAAARHIAGMGVKTLVIKRGEYGAILMHGTRLTMIPAFPLEAPIDPTGAGDSFAGAFLGYLDACRTVSMRSLKTALWYATVVSSFTVGRLGSGGLTRLDKRVIKNRLNQFKKML